MRPGDAVARALGALVMLAVTACEAPPADITSIAIRVPSSLECRPTRLRELRVLALGDFATTTDLSVPLPDASELPPLPPSTLALAFHGSGEPPEWQGRGVAHVDASGASDAAVLLLPPLASCALADPEASAPRGAAVAVLDDGTLVIAGGEMAGAAVRRVVSLRRGDELSQRSALDLLVPTTGASATSMGEEVVIAGGGSDGVGVGLDTYEVLDPRALAGTEHRAGVLVERRRDHASIATREGPVLIGGRGSVGGAPLATLERVDVAVARGRTLPLRLVEGRVSPIVARLSDGSLLVAGGRDAAGGAIASVERSDPEWARFERASLPLPPPAAIAALVGDRLLWIGEDGSLTVVIAGPDGLVEAVPLASVITGLRDPLAIGAAGGQALVLGRDPMGRAVAVRVDPGRDRVEPIDASRAASLAVSLGDSVIVELDAAGASLRATGDPIALDPPKASYLFAVDRAELALDAAPRFEVGRDALIARADGARVDVPALRFARFALTLEASGGVELLLHSEESSPLVIAIDDGRASIGACGVERASGADVRVVRAGAGTIELSAGAGTVRCESLSMAERVAVAVRASRGARLVSMSLERL